MVTETSIIHHMKHLGRHSCNQDQLGTCMHDPVTLQMVTPKHTLPLSLLTTAHCTDTPTLCTHSPQMLLLLLQVHNNTRTNQQRGLDLAAAALDNDHQTPDQDRELRYYLAGL